MKIWTRSFFAVLLLVGVGSWLGGCSKKDGNTIHLSSWGDPQENEILQELITQFQQVHPEIHVVLDRVPFGSYAEKLMTQYAGGVAPDVIFVSSENLADFYPSGMLEPLTSYLKADPTVDLKELYPTLVNWYTIKGDVAAIPRDIAPVCVIYYNKKLFDDAKLPYPKDDWTADEFLAVAQKLTQRDAKGHVTVWGYADDYPIPEQWMYAFGGRYVDDSHNPTKYTLDQPGFIKGVQFRSDLMNKYKVMPSPASQSQQGLAGAADLFANGSAAMLLSGIWKVPMFRQSKELKWDVVQAPHVPGVSRAVVGGSSGYGIISKSQHKDAAWKLIAFLSSPEGQSQFAATGLIQPARKKVAESSAFLDGKDPQNKKFLLSAVDYAVDDPMSTNWREVKQGIIVPELDKVWNGTETAQQAVDKLMVVLQKHKLVFEDKRTK